MTAIFSSGSNLPPEFAGKSYFDQPEKPHRKEKRQQVLEELCARTIRALTGENSLRFRGHRLEQQGAVLPFRAGHLQVDVDQDDFASFRGAADGLALRIIHSDQKLHRQLMPELPHEQVIFELLEQLRVESQISDDHPGIRLNLKHRFRVWCQQFLASGLTENQIGLMIFCIAQTAWSRISGNPTLEETEALIEPQRAVLAPHIGHALYGLRKTLTNQAAFAEHALSIARELTSIINAHQPENTDENSQRAQSKALKNENFSLLLEPDDSANEFDQPGIASQQSSYRQLEKNLADYRIFDASYDNQINAAQVARLEQRQQLRQQLDRRIEKQGINIPRLSRKLSQILSAPRLDGWQFDLDEGRLNARSLSRLVTSPTDHRLFRQEISNPHTDCQVTFVIDNSGSMKQHIESIAMLVDVLCRALEQAGSKTEVLGFTTGAWNGGKPFKKWSGMGKKANPGRLNQTTHICYKNADTTWRRARTELSAMLKTTHYRESVDGEALLWAAQRLKSQQANRKLLIVISDGCPVDSATAHNNPEHFLESHLQQVSSWIEHHHDIELFALGVGLDLSHFYRNHLALDLSLSLDNAVFNEIIKLISKR